jgi:hypothetical protein
LSSAMQRFLLGRLSLLIRLLSISYVDIHILEMCHQTLGLYFSTAPQWVRPE